MNRLHRFCSAFLAVCFLGGVSQAQTPTSRMSITEFVKDENRVAALKRGVATMRDRMPSDPKSWFFQAAIHGVTPEAVADAAASDPAVSTVDQAKFWNQCPHDGAPSADFLLWHRAYVFYFERILREASGDPTLSLPYWNYTGADRAFPSLFGNAEEMDGVPTNPLYEERRELLFVFGLYELADGVVTTAIIFAETDFFGASESTGFAGGVGDADPSTRGLVERQPHDLMHVAIGGVIGNDVGLMSFVPTAAFDPVFWVHHTNIDRLWSQWDTLSGRQWGAVPALDWFHSSPWFFHDVDGSVENQPRYHWLKYRDLGVTYDDDDPADPRLSDNLPEGVGTATLLLAGSGIVSERRTRVALSATRPVTLGVSVDASRVTAEGMQALVAGAGPPAKRVVLELTYSAPETIPNVSYNVFLVSGDAAAAVEPKPGSAEHIGTLNLFGTRHDHGGRGDHGGHEPPTGLVTQTFDLTNLVTGRQTFDPGRASVVVRPFDLFKTVRADVAMVRRSGGIVVHDVKIRIK